MKKADPKWKKIQQTTFTNWVNEALKSTKYRVKDLKVDLKDGLVLIALLEALTSPGKIGNYSKRPKIKAHMIENLVACFKFMESENIKLVNVGKLLVIYMPRPFIKISCTSYSVIMSHTALYMLHY